MNNRTQIQKKIDLQMNENPFFILDIDNSGADEKTKKTVDFNQVLIDALDTVFAQLGCKQEVYQLLNKKYGISKCNLSKNIQVFVLALEDIFSDASLIVESRVMQAICPKVNDFTYYPTKDEFVFCDYLVTLCKFVN